MPNLRQALESGRIILMDGAVGTELQRTGFQPGKCYESCNLTHPDKVCGIHRAYLEAGAECILTNTFQGNPQALARFGLQDQLERLNQKAISLARAAADTGCFVLASIGPMKLSNGFDDFDRTLRSLENVDGWLLETWSNDFENAAARALDPTINKHEIPVLLSLTFCRSNHADENTVRLVNQIRNTEHRTPNTALAAIGINCGLDVGLPQIKTIIRNYREQTNLPLLVRPNAGTPKRVADRSVYPRAPEQMAKWIPELIQAGVQLIGGCCGTTPEHIAAFRRVL